MQFSRHHLWLFAQPFKVKNNGFLCTDKKTEAQREKYNWFKFKGLLIGIPNQLHLILVPKLFFYSPVPCVSPNIDLLPWGGALRGASSEWKRGRKKGKDPERVELFLRIHTHQ